MANGKELVNKVKAGDTESFYFIIEENKRLVYNIVFRMVPNEADREDICQDIFIKVYQNLGGFQFESKLSTWIARIAFNTSINYLKKKKLPLFDDFAAEGESIETFLQDTTTPDEYTEESDLSTRLQHEIEMLPPQFRTLLTLFHVEEMGYSEIAKITGLPDGTVKSYLFRARKLLKEKLTEKYQKEELWQ